MKNEQQLKPDPEAISSYIHASKYARYIPALKRRESFNETVQRVKWMHKKRFPQLEDQIEYAFNFVHQKKVLPSMRSMQFAGKPIEERNERIYNCSFTLVDRPEVFGQIIYALLCGCGAGFSVQKQHVEKLPELKMIDKSLVCHHSIKDTIEGWADAVTALVNSFIHGYYIEFNYNQIRPAGSQLKSGGKAPGHLDLKEMLEVARNILNRAQGRKLSPLECHDIICHISKAVLAGGIRRSSLISLFSFSDDEMLNCKSRNCFDFGTQNSQRSLANNSVVLSLEDCTREDFERIIILNKYSYGEPGFIFVENLDFGINPCGEIGVNPVWESQTGFGFCNLVEINMAICKDEQDFYDAAEQASFIATLQASYTDFSYFGTVTEKITERDSLIGVSIIGMMDAPWIFNEEILRIGANFVKVKNAQIAKEIGINPAIRCTCIKPGGASSLELGCISNGIHPHFAKYYFQRVTANPLEPIAQFFKNVNPQMVEVKPDGDWCLTFPVQTEGIVQKDITAIEFLEKILLTYENWILPTCKIEPTHNVSCTIMIKDNEWDEVSEYIWNNRHKIRCATFLPMKSDVKVPFMPKEETLPDNERWKLILENYQPVNYELVEESEDVTIRGAACDSDRCGIDESIFVQSDGYRIFEGEAPHPTGQFEIDNLWFELVKQYEGYYISKRIIIAV